MAEVFNYLTGYSQTSRLQTSAGRAGLPAAQRFLELIEREIAHARAGRPARILLKNNAVTDPAIVRALYRASQEGVEIDMIVAASAAFAPGLEGVSERIRVRSVVGRFLEHSRVYWFANGGEP